MLIKNITNQKLISICLMGNNNASFADIQRKHGAEGVNYIVSKYHERKIYGRINDQIKTLKDHANLQQQEDIELIYQYKRQLQKALTQAKNQAQLKKKGSIQQAEAKSKQKIQSLSGYNEQVKKIQKLDKQLREKYEVEKVKMQERVRDQVKKHQSALTLNKVPAYDDRPDNYRHNLEGQCIEKYPERANQIDSTELEKKLVWDNYKQSFISILDREKLKQEVQTASQSIMNNVIPGGAPICC